MNKDEREELQRLRHEMDLSSLGDRPQSIVAAKLGRLIELEAQAEQEKPEPYCWVCRTHHQLTAANCPAMWDIT